jgi:predicted MFS family arabinose efflux permease
VGGVQGLIEWGPIPLGALVGGLLLQWLGGVTTTLALAAALLAIAVAASASPAVRHAPRLTRTAGETADRDVADTTPSPSL